MTEIQLDYAVPAADLTDYVSLFYDFRADVAIFQDTERAGNAQIRFRHTAGGTTYRFSDGSVQTPADSHVLGPTSGAVHVHAIGPITGFGMGITAAGWAAIVGADASTMLNCAIDASDLFGSARIRAVESAMAAASDIGRKVGIAEALVRELIRGGDIGATRFVGHVEAWLAGSPSPQMTCLIEASGLSRRQIERKCNALYGAPPKVLARKYRALRAAVAMIADGEALDDVIDRGFYDQSHMIREVKQFTGLTPGQIRAEPTVLAQLTIIQRTALGGRISPLISGT